MRIRAAGPAAWTASPNIWRGPEPEPMCPACIATAALIVAGATSAGGLGALVANNFRAKISDPTTQTGGEQDDAQPDRDARRVARRAEATLEQGEGTHPP